MSCSAGFTDEEDREAGDEPEEWRDEKVPPFDAEDDLVVLLPGFLLLLVDVLVQVPLFLLQFDHALVWGGVALLAGLLCVVVCNRVLILFDVS